MNDVKYDDDMPKPGLLVVSFQRLFGATVLRIADFGYRLILLRSHLVWGQQP